MSIRYIEKEEIQSKLFLHYFLYTRFKYTKKNITHEDVGEAVAHYYLVKFFYKLSKKKTRTTRSDVNFKINRLALFNDSTLLESSMFKYKETILNVSI